MATDAVVTVTHAKHGHVGRISVAWTADSADGSFPDTVLPVFEGRLAELTTDPGSTAPTALYDITLVDVNVVDRLQGLGANRSATVTETVPIVYSGSTIHPPVGLWDALTLKLANNAVHSATGLIVLIYVPV